MYRYNSQRAAEDDDDDDNDDDDDDDDDEAPSVHTAEQLQEDRNCFPAIQPVSGLQFTE